MRYRFGLNFRSAFRTRQLRHVILEHPYEQVSSFGWIFRGNGVQPFLEPSHIRLGKDCNRRTNIRRDSVRNALSRTAACFPAESHLTHHRT